MPVEEPISTDREREAFAGNPVEVGDDAYGSGGPRVEARGPPDRGVYGVSLDMKMSVRLARLPSFVIAKKATNEFPARARPS